MECADLQLNIAICTHWCYLLSTCKAVEGSKFKPTVTTHYSFTQCHSLPQILHQQHEVNSSKWVKERNLIPCNPRRKRCSMYQRTVCSLHPPPQAAYIYTFNSITTNPVFLLLIPQLNLLFLLWNMYEVLSFRRGCFIHSRDLFFGKGERVAGGFRDSSQLASRLHVNYGTKISNCTGGVSPYLPTATLLQPPSFPGGFSFSPPYYLLFVRQKLSSVPATSPPVSAPFLSHLIIHTLVGQSHIT